MVLRCTSFGLTSGGLWVSSTRHAPFTGAQLIERAHLTYTAGVKYSRSNFYMKDYTNGGVYLLFVVIFFHEDSFCGSPYRDSSYWQHKSGVNLRRPSVLFMCWFPEQQPSRDHLPAFGSSTSLTTGTGGM